MRLNHRDDQPYDVGVVATEHYKIRRHVLGQSSIIETCPNFGNPASSSRYFDDPFFLESSAPA